MNLKKKMSSSVFVQMVFDSWIVVGPFCCHREGESGDALAVPTSLMLVGREM